MPDIEPESVAASTTEPVRRIAGDDQNGPVEGRALCLSGGGYRAMLFHVGSIWRLHEAGVLGSLKRISSVSGGSITSAVLGLAWKQVKDGDTEALKELVVAPIRALADRTIDAGSILGGVFLPGSVSDWVTGSYRKHLFGDKTLQNLPADDEGPRFIINATNVQSGALWRFSRPYMGDYRVGLVRSPKVSIAAAVAASSAFPPVLSPHELDLTGLTFDPATIGDLKDDAYRQRALLSDGGVYDNIGLETAWKQLKTVFVSDAGQKMSPEVDPDTDWAQHAIRVLGVIDNQVRSLRKRQVIDAIQNPKDEHDGAYWSIAGPVFTPIAPGAIPCTPERVAELAATPTRLKRLDSVTQERLINWGYACCDAAMRKFFDSNFELSPACPYPASGI